MNALRILVEFLQQLCRAGSFACSQIGIWGYILLTFWKWGRTWAPLHLPVCFMLFLKGLTLPDLLACLLPGQPPHHPAVPSPSNTKHHHQTQSNTIVQGAGESSLAGPNLSPGLTNVQSRIYSCSKHSLTGPRFVMVLLCARNCATTLKWYKDKRVISLRSFLKSGGRDR